jgi:Regulator of ribonuclease activity B
LVIGIVAVVALFKRRQTDAGGPSDARDQQLVALLRKRGADLTQPRHVRHYLYVDTQESAETAAADLVAEGWDCTVEPAATGDNWLVLSERDAVASSAAIDAWRVTFETLAGSFSGGEYDGWEASV